MDAFIRIFSFEEFPKIRLHQKLRLKSDPHIEITSPDRNVRITWIDSDDNCSLEYYPLWIFLTKICEMGQCVRVFAYVCCLSVFVVYDQSVQIPASVSLKTSSIWHVEKWTHHHFPIHRPYEFSPCQQFHPDCLTYNGRRMDYSSYLPLSGD